ncbi:MAG: tRNA lysidine(34) synthetase TilS [Bacilli bacterium]|nr:tRNA lysidine(34) synthetase TilS [Bacilli bacterium]MDD4076394.1 tRNA lysidine(34) synthetase TilS [Bacilli bacterium]MDD4389096.1 tRNA lysidine(34) synthetase TilS [Bacilli bacterium]
MIERILNFFEDNKLSLNDKKLVVAVSTGVDSMVLLDVLIRLRECYPFIIYVAHVNHHQRKQAKEEEKYIKSFCLCHNIKCYVYHLKISKDDNFQDYAHHERHHFFSNLMAELAADYLLLAHHANDNIETIIMRTIRGSNLKGYAGIAPLVNADGFLLIRPFADILKKEIIDYARENKIKYYQDETNFLDMYTRNRIRKNIVPLLFEEDVNVHRKFREFSDTLIGAWDVVRTHVDGIIEKTVKIEKDKLYFSQVQFEKLSEFLQYEVLFTLLKRYQLSKVHVAEIIKLIKSSKKNQKLYFKNLFTFVKEYDLISIYHRKLSKLKIDFEITGPGQYPLNDSISVNVLKNSHFNILKPNEIWYNNAMLPVRVRTRKPGDKILLDVGYKKVKDILIDKKIGILKREQVLIIEKNEEILAIPGIVKSQHLKTIKEKDILIKVEYNEE